MNCTCLIAARIFACESPHQGAGRIAFTDDLDSPTGFGTKVIHFEKCYAQITGPLRIAGHEKLHRNHRHRRRHFHPNGMQHESRSFRRTRWPQPRNFRQGQHRRRRVRRCPRLLMRPCERVACFFAKAYPRSALRVRLDGVKPIALLAIAFAVVTQSGCLSQRAARYAYRHGSSAIRSHAEALRESRDAREVREQQNRQDDRADFRPVPVNPRQDDRPDLR